MEEIIDVSVIVLTYYHEKYIAKALDSILAQDTNLRYEILIGDDASEDRTPEVILEYAARYPLIIKPVLRKKNMGATHNSQNMRMRAKGKYTAYLDGDDFWLDSKKLQKQFDFLETHPEFAGCCGKCLVVDESGIPDYTQTPQFVENRKVFTMEDYLARWNLDSQAGSLMHRSFSKDYSDAYALHRNVGDKTTAMIILSQGPIYCFNQIFSAYRRVIAKDGHNYFSQHYANPNRHYDMFMYPCRLEAWGKKRLGLNRNVHVGPRRDFRFAHFVEQTVREPSIKRLKYLAEMMIASRQPVKYSWLALKTLIVME